MKKDKNKSNYTNQKINCDVVDCEHNCNEDCTCRLDGINVCTCTSSDEAKTADGTACKSYNCKC